MDIGIFIEYKGRVVQIPVNPPSFNVNTEGNNDTVEIITLGEVVLPKKAKLSSISWECFFPHDNWYPAIRTKGKFKSGDFYVNFINKIRDACEPCHLTVTGIGFDDDVVIDTFDYYHQAGDHEDTYYSISLKQYRPYAVSIVSKVDIVAEGSGEYSGDFAGDQLIQMPVAGAHIAIGGCQVIRSRTTMAVQITPSAANDEVIITVMSHSGHCICSIAAQLNGALRRSIQGDQ